MGRLTACLLLLLTSMIWGYANVSMKTVLEHVGPLSALGLRFLLAALVVSPLMIREVWLSRAKFAKHWGWLVLVALMFGAAMGLQQVGIKVTTVSNGAFLCSTQVVFVPFLAWFWMGKRPHALVWPAISLATFGVYLLSGVDLTSLGDMNWGDALYLLSAVFWAAHVTVVGMAMQRLGSPCAINGIQCLVTGSIFLGGATASEPVTFAAIQAAAFVEHDNAIREPQGGKAMRSATPSKNRSGPRRRRVGARPTTGSTS